MIKVEHLTFSYNNSQTAIKDLCFNILAGEIFGFLGPSGAGKSTTQKIMMRLLKGYHGQAEIMGKSLLNWGHDYFEHVGISFELPSHYRKLTALENLNFFAGLFTRATQKPETLLEMLDLSDSANKPVEQFSKGMQIRLNFARSLLQNPEILFLDEPTAGLDPVNARRVKQIIKDQKARGCTIFLTTHDMNVANELCDRVGFLVDGQLQSVDAPDALRLKHGRRIVKIHYENSQAIGMKEFPLDGLGQNSEFLALLREHRVETIHSQEPSLEDIFIKLTGKSLS